MIIEENVLINNKYFRHTYSDENYKIQKVGTSEIYIEAYDIITNHFQYIETNDKIEIVKQ